MKLSVFISACILLGSSCLTFAMEEQDSPFKQFVKRLNVENKLNATQEHINRYVELLSRDNDWEILGNEEEPVKQLSRVVLDHTKKQVRFCHWYKNVWTSTMFVGLVGLGMGCFSYFAKPEYQISFLKSEMAKGIFGLGSLALIAFSSYQRKKCVDAGHKLIEPLAKREDLDSKLQWGIIEK